VQDVFVAGGHGLNLVSVAPGAEMQISRSGR
jgi:hypothetical protein